MASFFRIPVLLLFLALSSAAQTDSVYMGRDPDKNPAPRKDKERNTAWKEKFIYGGNFQAWVGNPTFVFLSPTIGYVPVKNLNIGVGLVYNYTSADYGIYGKYSQSIFGGHSYVRYIIAESYFVQVQNDRLYQPDWYHPTQRKVWVNYAMVGGGFRQEIGDKMALTSSIMFNLTPNPLSIYPSRLIIQFGFTAGF